MQRNQRRQKRSAPRSGFPSAFPPGGYRGNNVSAMQPQVHVIEQTSMDVATTSASNYASTIDIEPSSLISAAHLAAYQALYDECRIDEVDFLFLPRYGPNVGGRMCFYIERELTQSVVATYILATQQREATVGRLYENLTLIWKPISPAEREFQPLDPGNVKHGAICCKCDNLIDSTPAAIANGATIGTFVITTHMTCIGRPDDPADEPVEEVRETKSGYSVPSPDKEGTRRTFTAVPRR